MLAFSFLARRCPPLPISIADPEHHCCRLPHESFITCVAPPEFPCTNYLLSQLLLSQRGCCDFGVAIDGLEVSFLTQRRCTQPLPCITSTSPAPDAPKTLKIVRSTMQEATLAIPHPTRIKDLPLRPMSHSCNGLVCPVRCRCLSRSLTSPRLDREACQSLRRSSPRP